MLDQLEAEFPEHTPRPAGAPMALEGIRVIDFSHFIAGPFATMILADMGAEQASCGLAVARFERGENVGVLVDRVAPALVGAQRQVTCAFGAGD